MLNVEINLIWVSTDKWLQLVEAVAQNFYIIAEILREIKSCMAVPVKKERARKVVAKSQCQ
jgi:hypothetical protein